mgnify:CR=1 FL=1
MATKRKYFSGPEEYANYTPYVLVVNGEIQEAFTSKQSAERAREKLPFHVYGYVMTRKQFAKEHA